MYFRMLAKHKVERNTIESHEYMIQKQRFLNEIMQLCLVA